MYCQHCGKDVKIDEKELSKIELNDNKEEYVLNDKIEKVYICPRCNHVIKEHLSQDDLKELSQASHAQVHRYKNTFSSGMVFLMIGIILTAVGLLFFRMAHKVNWNGDLVNPLTGQVAAEFFVFIVLCAIGLVLLVIGAVKFTIGVKGTKKYQNLLKDIQNDTFVQ